MIFGRDSTNIQSEGEKAAIDGGPRRTAIERSLAG